MTNVVRNNNTSATTTNTQNANGGRPVRSGAMTTSTNYWATAPLPPGMANAAQRVAALTAQVKGPTTTTATTAGASAGAAATTPAPTLPPPPSFVESAGSGLLSSYSGNLDQLCKDAEIKGDDDRQRFNSAMNMLGSAAARPTTVSPEGTSSSGPKLHLTAEQIAAIQSAPTPEAAKAEVLKAISAQTGIPVNQLDPTNAGKKGNRAAREALNALLGTNIKDGREKNAGSAMILDGICESIANGVRSMPASGATVRAFGGEFPGVNDPAAPAPGAGTVAPERQGTPVDMCLDDYLNPAREVAELNSPLVFDLSGTGLKLKQGELIEIDIDGDGKKEVITNLDKGMGLLVFDSKCKVRGDSAAGRDYFGDRTDLSAYGIVSRQADKKWANGFDPLRALAEHFDLVRKDKQYLDAADLKLLEQEVGLRMRLDGVKGSDRTFAEVGITRIDLGDPKKIVSLRDAKSDAFGNKIMTQAGATFVVKGKTREYADLWFNVQARAKATASSNANANAAKGAQQGQPLKASAMSFARRM